MAADKLNVSKSQMNKSKRKGKLTQDTIGNNGLDHRTFQSYRTHLKCTVYTHLCWCTRMLDIQDLS